MFGMRIELLGSRIADCVDQAAKPAAPRVDEHRASSLMARLTAAARNPTRDPNQRLRNASTT
jgi:hypothetical protein